MVFCTTKESSEAFVLMDGLVCFRMKMGLAIQGITVHEAGRSGSPITESYRETAITTVRPENRDCTRIVNKVIDKKRFLLEQVGNIIP